jgi:hypothetical protein
MRREAFALLVAMMVWPLLQLAWKVRRFFVTRGESRLRGIKGRPASLPWAGRPHQEHKHDAR